MSIGYDNTDDNNISEFKIIDSTNGNSDEYKLCNDESISSEDTSNYPILKKSGIENLKYSDRTEDGSSDSLNLFESKFSETNTLKDSNETSASLPKEDTDLSPIPVFFICSSLPLPTERKEEEEELIIDDLTISNETNSFNEKDRSGHDIFKPNICTIEETKKLDLNEESKKSFTLEKSDLKYCTKSPVEMYEYIEKNEKVVCSKENDLITKLSCLKEKSTEKFVCVSCVIKNEMKCNEFEDWCDYSRIEKEGFKKCIVCKHFKPLFAYIKRSSKGGECREIKTCLFCRNKKKLKQDNNKTTKPCKLPPISLPSINEPIVEPLFNETIVKPLFVKPSTIKDVKKNVIEEEIKEFLKNKSKKCQCCNCKDNIFLVDGLNKEDNFFCKECLTFIKNFKLCEYADPIYKCHDYDDDKDKRLVYCTRCCKYKRIASFLKGDEKEIKMYKYCRFCALKRRISKKK